MRPTPIVGLGCLAAANVGLYWLGITRQYPLAKGLRGTHLSWPALVDRSLRAGWAHAGIYALLILCYMLAMWLAARISPRRTRHAMAVIVGSWLLCSAALLPGYPGESLDIFDYLVRGRMQVIHGVSPLAVTPNAFPAERFYGYATWKEWVDAYGPLWEYPSGLVARAVRMVSQGSVQDYILGYRLLAIAMAGLCGVLIFVIARRRVPRYGVMALLAWLWNPLLLITSTLGAHNDGIMLALILLALLLEQRDRWFLALLALGLAAHVKITALLLLPVMGLCLVRRWGWRSALGTSFAAIALLFPLSWALYAPLGGWKTLPRMLRERHILTYNSLANIAYDLHYLHWHRATPARQAAIRGATLLFLLLAACLLLWWWRRTRNRPADDPELWRMGIAVTMLYLIVGCFWFQEWYVTWVLVLAALLPDDRFTRWAAPLFSLGALWSNISTEFLNQDPAHRFQPIQVDTIMVATLLTPLACALMVPMLGRLMRRPGMMRGTLWRRPHAPTPPS